jgi:hypothetical protein
MELRHALTATRESLFEKVDYFLDHESSRRHLLVLADSGTGKTSFVLNYYVHNANRSRRKRHPLALVPLGIIDADQLIAAVPNPEDTAIFLDALDEDIKAIEGHRARIDALMQATRRFRRVIITCRTQFFPSEEEIPVETGVARLGPRHAGQSATYEFWKLYLSPFDDEDVRKYLRLRYPLWRRTIRRQATELALRVPLLSARPMLLAHIPDVIASGRDIKQTYQLYETMIDAWLQRETSWVDKGALREFSERLAADICVKRDMRGMERVPFEELCKLASEWGIGLHQWQIRGRSLLNRDAQGNYKFAHRSILEYFFVVRLTRGDQACNEVLLTDQMKRFLLEMAGLPNDDMRLALRVLLDLDITARPVPRLDCPDVSEAMGRHVADPLLKLTEGDFARSWAVEQFLDESKGTMLLRQRPMVERLRSIIQRLEAAPSAQAQGALTEVVFQDLRELSCLLPDPDGLIKALMLDPRVYQNADVLHILKKRGIELMLRVLLFNGIPRVRLMPELPDCRRFVLEFVTPRVILQKQARDRIPSPETVHDI